MNPDTERTIAIIQGEYHISRDPGDVLVTILGSCVAACIRDPVAGVGGLNHFLLPGGGGSDTNTVKYGLQAMELLINALIRAGAQRNRLEAKLFGGARIQAGLRDIGRSNAEFAEGFLRSEGIRHVGGSLGGSQGRKLRFWPVSGAARQLLLANTELPPEPAIRAPIAQNTGEVTLF
jgi:chemotaxis protein CheD